MHSHNHYSGASLFVRSKLDDLKAKRALKSFADSHPSVNYNTLVKFRKNPQLVYPEFVKILMQSFGLLDISYSRTFMFVFPDQSLNYDRALNIVLPGLKRMAKKRKLAEFVRSHDLSYPTLSSLKNGKLPYKHPKFLLHCLIALGFEDVKMETDYIYTYIIPKHMKKLLTVNPLLYGSPI